MSETTSTDDISVIRRDNLASLVQLMGGNISEFARVTGKNRRVLNDSLNGKRNIGARLAESIELALNLPAGSLSKANSPVIQSISDGLNIHRLPLYSPDRYFDQKRMPHFAASSWLAYGGGDPDDLVAVKVIDASLEPQFQIGDELIFQKSKKARVGDYVLCEIISAQTTVIRQFAKPVKTLNDVLEYELKPTNPVYPIITTNEKQSYIIGVCIEFRRRIK